MLAQLKSKTTALHKRLALFREKHYYGQRGLAIVNKWLEVAGSMLGLLCPGTSSRVWRHEASLIHVLEKFPPTTTADNRRASRIDLVGGYPQPMCPPIIPAGPSSVTAVAHVEIKMTLMCLRDIVQLLSGW